MWPDPQTSLMGVMCYGLLDLCEGIALPPPSASGIKPFLSMYSVWLSHATQYTLSRLLKPSPHALNCRIVPFVPVPE